MLASYSQCPPPRVKEHLAPDAKLRATLEPIWNTAKEDPSAFYELEPLLIAGQLDNFGPYNELASHLLAFRPPGVEACSQSKPMDTYVLEIFKGFWNLACMHPRTFSMHYPGSEAIADIGFSFAAPRHRPNRLLAFHVDKLQNAGKWRLSRSDSGICPVDQLPPEILSQIFGLLRESSPLFDHIYTRDLWNISAHLPVEQVSKRWATIAAHTPEVWVPMVQDFGKSMAKRALKLSKNMTLHARVHAHVGWTASHNILFQAENLPRIGSVRIESRLLDTFMRLPSLLEKSSAPRLTSIILLPSFDCEGRHSIFVTSNVFQATTPINLKHVELEDCRIAYPSPLWSPAITSLKLTRCEVWRTMDSVIDSLSSMPALEVFKWHMGQNTIANTNSPIRLLDAMLLPATVQPAKLSSLHILDVECPMTCIATLMAHIIIPPSCRVYVADDYTLTGEHDHDRGVCDGLLVSLGALGNHLSRMFPDHWNAGCDAISCKYHPDSERHKGALYIIGGTDKDTRSMCSVAIFVADQHPGKITDDLISSLLRRVLQWPAMSVASSFKTNHECFANPALWTTVLSCLPHIRQLYLEDDATSHAITGLSEALKHSPAIVPALTQIHLDYMSFPPSTQRSLAEAAKARSATGHGKIALGIRRCSDVEVGPLTLSDAICDDSGGALYLDPPYTDIFVIR